jgi:hypothetical protein
MDVVLKNEDVKMIIESIQNLVEGGDLPEIKDGYVSEATLKRQKEESERWRAEQKSTDDVEDE